MALAKFLQHLSVLLICATSQSNDLLVVLLWQGVRWAYAVKHLEQHIVLSGSLTPGVLLSVSTLEYKLGEGRDRTHLFTDSSLAPVLAHE